MARQGYWEQGERANKLDEYGTYLLPLDPTPTDAILEKDYIEQERPDGKDTQIMYFSLRCCFHWCLGYVVIHRGKGMLDNSMEFVFT